MAIEIMNLRNGGPNLPYDVRVDRSSPLGNPFPMSNESEREVVCDKYTAWFDGIVEGWTPGEVVTKNKDQFHFLWKLILLYREYGRLRLFCWCAPKRCHVETIRNYILLQE